MRAVPISWMANPGGLVLGEGLDFARARGGQHFRGRDGHVLRMAQFIFAPGAMNLQDGDSPGVHLFLIEFHVVVVIRQAFAIAAKVNRHGPGRLMRFFEIGAEANLRDAALPAFAVSAALITVSAQEIGCLVFMFRKRGT